MATMTQSSNTSAPKRSATEPVIEEHGGHLAFADMLRDSSTESDAVSRATTHYEASASPRCQQSPPNSAQTSPRCQRSHMSFIAPLTQLQQSHKRIPSLGHPRAFKRLLMFNGVVRVAQPGYPGLTYSQLDLQANMSLLRKLATRQICVSTDPQYTMFLQSAGAAIAAAILGNFDAWEYARQSTVVQLFSHCMEDCFVISQDRKSQSTDRILALLSGVESVWALFWELLKLYPKDCMEDLCKAKTVEWLTLQLSSSRSEGPRQWASQILSRLSHMMHVSSMVTQHFVDLYPLLLQSNPNVWRTEEEQGMLLRLSSAVLDHGGPQLMTTHITHVLGFCCRLVRLETRGNKHMQFMLEYLVVAVIFGQVATIPTGRERLTHKDCALALEEIATSTRRQDVACVAWALLAYPLYEADSVFGSVWWDGVGMAAQSDEEDEWC